MCPFIFKIEEVFMLIILKTKGILELLRFLFIAHVDAFGSNTFLTTKFMYFTCHMFIQEKFFIFMCEGDGCIIYVR